MCVSDRQPDGDAAGGRRCTTSLTGLRGCTPVRGPRGRPVKAVAVDDGLVWVTEVPAQPVAAARPSSPAALAHLGVLLTKGLAAAGAAGEAGWPDATLLDAAVRAVAGYLDDLPELPFMDEPFGGEEGTD